VTDWVIQLTSGKAVTIKYSSYPQTSPDYSRYHGRKIDGTLPSDFWSSEPADIIAVEGYGFDWSEQVTLAAGTHTIEFGNSAESSNPWLTKIDVNNNQVGSGNVTRYQHLTVTFSV
jgi:hypothetical protein